MTQIDPQRDDGSEAVQTSGATLSLFGLIVRLVARLWVTSLLLLAAAFGGISVYQLLQTRAELAELREAPGPEAYAVVAYRRELERQIQAYSRNWRAEAVPAPPPRPRLLEEIDIARPRERERVGRPAELEPISAPQ
jgi:hypothetical protein